jgi:hypothetical protein
MPNRGELALRHVPVPDSTAADADAWLIIGLCAVGFLISAYLAFHAQPLADLPTLVVQYNFG